jgi:6-phosphogluconolactonase
MAPHRRQREQYALIVETLADADALAQRVAEWLLEKALATEGMFALCLSGGSTPRLLYERLGDLRDRFPWARTHLFWGDERFVPHTDKDSNYRMVRESLLALAGMPPANIHPIPTEGLDPETAARRYEETLRGFRQDSTPLFDVVLLGLGNDGHTASLFPGTTALDERTRWVVPVIGAMPEPRITLTYPALESSGAVAFLVSGAAKRDILAKVLSGKSDVPAARLAPRGELIWFTDRAAHPPL